MKHMRKDQQRKHRHHRVRTRVHGTAARPRLTVFRSLTHISAQLIDDDAGRTIVSASDHEAGKKERGMAAATFVGAQIAEKAKKAGVTSIVFDRSGYAYHGRVAALAQAARDGGLQF